MIFSFPIHNRKPTMQMMFFHLQGEHTVYFKKHEDLDEVINKISVPNQCSHSRMVANQVFPKAKNLKYAQFVLNDKDLETKKKRSYHWKLIWVPPSTGNQCFVLIILGKC